LQDALIFPFLASLIHPTYFLHDDSHTPTLWQLSLSTIVKTNLKKENILARQ
jgi:hypothetical protein